MRERILVVEDEIIVALDLEHILLSAGHEVVGIAPDTDTALDIAASCTLALVDINLRDGQTGPSIAREIARRHGARILFVTANPEQIGDAVAIADGFVSKPFDSRSILRAVSGEPVGQTSGFCGGRNPSQPAWPPSACSGNYQ